MKFDKRNLKKGNTLIITPMVVLFSIIIILILGMFFVNAIKPFIWYEKLNDISNKYMFIIEKFGHLTYEEKNNLEKELIESGFDINNITITYPQTQKSYGEVLEFIIKYGFEVKLPTFNNINDTNKKIDIVVKKYSYSKV